MFGDVPPYVKALRERNLRQSQSNLDDSLQKPSNDDFSRQSQTSLYRNPRDNEYEQFQKSFDSENSQYLKQKINQLQDENNTLQDLVSSLKNSDTELSDCMYQLKRERATNDDLHNQISNLQRRLNNEEDTNRSLVQQINQFQTLLDSKQQLTESNEDAFQRINKEYQNLSADYQRALDTISSQKIQIRDLNHRISELQTKNNDLISQLQTSNLNSNSKNDYGMETDRSYDFRNRSLNDQYDNSLHQKSSAETEFAFEQPNQREGFSSHGPSYEDNLDLNIPPRRNEDDFTFSAPLSSQKTVLEDHFDYGVPPKQNNNFSGSDTGSMPARKVALEDHFDFGSSKQNMNDEVNYNAEPLSSRRSENRFNFEQEPRKGKTEDNTFSSQNDSQVQKALNRRKQLQSSIMFGDPAPNTTVGRNAAMKDNIGFGDDFNNSANKGFLAPSCGAEIGNRAVPSIQTGYAKSAMKDNLSFGISPDSESINFGTNSNNSYRDFGNQRNVPRAMQDAIGFNEEQTTDVIQQKEELKQLQAERDEVDRLSRQAKPAGMPISKYRRIQDEYDAQLDELNKKIAKIRLNLKRQNAI